MPARHSHLQVGHFHSALELLPANTWSAVLSFLLLFQYLATSDATEARELCVQTSLPQQYGHCLPCVLLATVAFQMCGCSAGHLSHCHTALMLLCGLTLITPRCMFMSTCHCCCRCGLNKLMSGDVGSLSLAWICLSVIDWLCRHPATLVTMHAPYTEQNLI